MIRYAQAYGSPANGGASLLTIPTVDDNKPRHLTGVFIGTQTNQLYAQVQMAGQTIATIDSTLFTRLNDFAELDEQYQTSIQFQVNLNNATGAAANNVPVIVRYEI